MNDIPSAEPLIEKGEASWHHTKRPNDSRRWKVILAASQFINLWFILAAYFWGRHQGGNVLPKLPTDIISKKAQTFHLQKLDDDFEVTDPANYKFKGLPRPELDAAWSSLYEHMNIRVHPDEKQASNFTSVQLNDGSGDYYGMPTVFHSLHCLKTIRQVQFPEAYPDAWELYKPPFKGGISDHLDHCIDNLRQAIMCQGDLALYRYKWLPGKPKPMPYAKMDHMCVNWDNLLEWARSRSFDINDKLLTAPDSDTPWDPNAQ